MKYLIIFIFLNYSFSLNASEIQDRKLSMQALNKLMKEANNNIRENILNSRTQEIFLEISDIFKHYPSLFPEGSFDGKTNASNDIIFNREKFNQISKDNEENAKKAAEAIMYENQELAVKHFQNLYSSCKSCHSRFKN
ncbi:MAG: hypothetical protein CMI90_03180 [Pelagibacteraceae bacterium]|jgi:cytochrome c556|nr:hypothetical protein [Pelagibacteraceae bacterium]|tara:strand:+ start:3205 stop:3618 length:414 start_codon:yes stop_codon:yes gene_type:complete